MATSSNVADDITVQQPVLLNRGHRKSVAEEAEETLLAVRKNSNTKDKQKKSVLQILKNLGAKVYDAEYREFLSRDAMGWLKLSFYYACFYIWLTCFFLFMLYIFWLLRIKGATAPVYHNEESVMHYKKVNPGLGFRPQINPENELVMVKQQKTDENLKSLELFLEKYEQNKDKQFSANDAEISFNYHSIIEGSPCSKEKKFGFDTTSPCVIIKLNRIFGWKPVVYNASTLPDKLSLVKSLNDEVDYNYVFLTCNGAESSDRDNIKELDYYSNHFSKKIGGIR
jgi:sodium/potassium-transporting ATPase subunit beta